MIEFLQLPENASLPLRDQICEMLSQVISRDLVAQNIALPSCRALAGHLGVSRNTVFAAYARMIDSGLVTSKTKSGYFVNADAVENLRHAGMATHEADAAFAFPDKLLVHGVRPSAFRKIDNPEDWNKYPYPFIYNQIDPLLFPIRDWRECMRQALNQKQLAFWSGDQGSSDSAALLHQIQQRLLAYRGLSAQRHEILITSGAQNAIYLAASLFGQNGQTVAVEDPCYPEARNAFKLAGSRVVGVPVDSDGLQIEKIPDGCSMVYTTPSHQFPTTVTLSPERRQALVDMAVTKGFVICEDDYEAEMNFVKNRGKPMRSLDRSGVVIYIGSLSKSLSPGLRLGYIVAHPDIIAEAKAIRRAIMRHPPTLLQDAMSLFLRLGYQDAHLQKLHRRYKLRWQEMRLALSQCLPDFHIEATQGGTSFWVTGPPRLDTRVLAKRLRAKGVLIDEGSVFFENPNAGTRSFRIGFAALPIKSILPGVQIIAVEARALLAEHS
ncbi:MAG: GntR family transcriptional regulator/MocR family aminotransferase [Pseudorhodobacter sp.]|jgi:GntR family transcriptional regulator/MocR family aminotransferase